MSDEEKQKHHHQPHAKKITAIHAKTLEIGKTYRSIASVDEDGFRRENVRRAVKTLGLHKGFFWCYKGNEIGAIRLIKKRGLEQRVKIAEMEKIHYNTLRYLYIKENLTIKEIAKKLARSSQNISQHIKKYNLYKRKNKQKLTPQLLRQELQNNKAISEIAKKYDIAKVTVSTYKSKWKKRGLI